MNEVIEVEERIVGGEQRSSSVSTGHSLVANRAPASAREMIEALRKSSKGESDSRAAAVFERQRALERITAETITHPVHERCIATIARMHAARRINATTPRGMLITGMSGCGKSTMAKSYAELYPRRDEDEVTVIPVLYVELPGQPTAKAFAESVLNAMGAEFAERGGAEDKLKRIRKLLVSCRVELIILDETQHLVENLDNRARDIAADTIKNLMNSTCIPHVFLGAPSCRAYFVRNQQLGRRCTPKVHLQPFGIASPPEKLAFQRLLKALALRLPFSKSPALLDTNLVEPLWYASFGLIGQLTQLVKAALELAFEQSAETLTREHLCLAFSETMFTGCPVERNPFERRFSRQPLTDAGEPYHGFVA